MAEGLCRKKAGDMHLDDISVSSAGLSAIPGDCVSDNAVAASKLYGIDISSHRARSLSRPLLEETDLFVCMTQSHALPLLAFAEKGSIIVLGNGISDPYGGDLETYSKCAGEISNAIDDLLEHLNERTFILPFGEKHVKALAEVEESCFSDAWSEKSLAEEIGNENSHFFVAVKGEEILGYIGTQSICGECYITRICVSENARKQGIGSRLLEKAIVSCKLRNDEFISLEVRKSNKIAIKLYNKFGFKKVGERKNFYRLPDEDAIIMTKTFR